ncbi:MAG: TAXI family TRAP transporter solute-binding subunit [Desulfovibrionaceae bacterium]|nr:TAXI family TRAP transporter solute-binding subunit [Desulfovibrionaceae bacterium]
MKNLKCMFLLLFVALCCSPQAAWSAEKPRVILLSTPFGTGSYALGSAFEAVINKYDLPLTMTHTETPGQVFNIQKINQDKAARKNTICMAGPATNWLAEHGQAPFKEKLEGLYLIGTFNAAALWLATNDKNIKSMQDLAGKRIALGRVPQTVWGYEPDVVLRKGYNEAFYKSLRIQFVGTSEAANALLNGQVDACVLGGYIDPDSGRFEAAPQTVEVLTAGRALIHLDWTKEAIEKAIADDVPMVPYQMPAGTVEGMDKPIWAFTDPSSFVAHAEFPEEQAYQLTKALIKYYAEFAGFHALGKLMTAKGLAFGWSVDRIHPGSLRAFRDAGLIQ